VGATVSVSVNFIKARFESFAARCDDMCKQLQTVADLSSEYWLLNVDYNAANPTDKDRELIQKAKLLEVRLIGLQSQILATEQFLFAEFASADRAKTTTLKDKLVDAVSGGDFSDRKGGSFHIQATQVQNVCGEFIVTVRNAVAKRYTVSYLTKRPFYLH
jgi:hypothetical protein